MTTLFISYSRKHPVYADFIAEDLEQDGFSIFIDRDGIHGSEDWQTRINSEVERCDAVIIIVTYEAARSEYVQAEAHLATKFGKPCFPLIMEPIEIAQALELLGCPNSQAIDFVQLRPKTAYSRLRQSLLYATDTWRPLEILVNKLNHYNARVRLDAVNKLCESGDPRVLPPLIDAASYEEDIKIVKATVDGMRFFNSPIAIDFACKVLSQALDDPKPRRDIPFSSIDVLGIIGINDLGVKEIFIKALDTNHLIIRLHVAEILQKFPDHKLKEIGFKTIVELLDRKDSTAIIGAARALTKIGDKRAIPYLEKHANTTHRVSKQIIDTALQVLRRDDQ